MFSSNTSCCASPSSPASVSPASSLSSSTPSGVPSFSRSRFPSVAPWALVERCLLHLLAKLGASERSWKAAEIVAALPSSFFPASTDPLVLAHSPSSPSKPSSPSNPSSPSSPSASATPPGSFSVVAVPSFSSASQEGEEKQEAQVESERESSSTREASERRETEEKRNDGGREGERERHTADADSGAFLSLPGVEELKMCVPLLRCPLQLVLLLCLLQETYRNPSSSSSSTRSSSSPSSPSSFLAFSSHSSTGECVPAQDDSEERFRREATDEEAREKSRRPWTAERQAKMDKSAQLKCTLKTLLLHWEELENAAVTVAAECRYSAYFEGQEREAEIVRGKVDTRIPPTIQYTRSSFPSFSTEELEQLEAHRPQSLREAARVPGLHPASLLSLYRFVSLSKKKTK